MINFKKKFKSFGPLEILVSASFVYVTVMLVWTLSTRSAVLEKANNIKSNHKGVVELLNNEINKCSQNSQIKTSWGEDCNSSWTSTAIIDHILKNIK